MSEILRTNRDLYVFVTRIADELGASVLSLEEYLRSLVALTEPYRVLEVLPLPLFANLLKGAFQEQGSPLSPTREQCGTSLPERFAVGYADWKTTIQGQILDLAKMREAGILDNEMRSKRTWDRNRQEIWVLLRTF